MAVQAHWLRVLAGVYGVAIVLASPDRADNLAGSTPAGQPAPTSASVDPELVLWNMVKDSTKANDFGFYLGRFPKGQHSGEARAKYRTLARQPLVSEGPTAKDAVPLETEPVVTKVKRPAAEGRAVVRQGKLAPKKSGSPTGVPAKLLPGKSKPSVWATSESPPRECTGGSSAVKTCVAYLKPKRKSLFEQLMDGQKENKSRNGQGRGRSGPGGVR